MFNFNNKEDLENLSNHLNKKFGNNEIFIKAGWSCCAPALWIVYRGIRQMALSKYLKNKKTASYDIEYIEKTLKALIKEMKKQ